MNKLCGAFTYLMGIIASINSPTPEGAEPTFEKKDSTRSLIIRLAGFVCG